MSRPSFFHHLHPPTIPKREASFTYNLGLGGLAVFLILVVGITGMLEMFYYVPSIEQANASVQTITYLVPLGWIVRGAHYWSAQALVVVTVLHLLRVALTGAYKDRRFNWLLGLMALGLILFLNFSGYALRWDRDISWALLVGTNLIKTIPFVGTVLYGVVVGGNQINSATPARFYAWHIFGLMLPAFIILVWHLFQVRRDGGIAHIAEARKSRISRDELVGRETFVALLATIALLAVSVLSPPAITPAADFASLPDNPTAPWFFVWVQELLRLGDPFFFGVLIPSIITILVALVPYLIDRSSSGVAVWFNKEGRVAQWIVWVMLLVIIGLTIRGALR
jgi:quinol-cytochrome oxidoreductase complex cytochrome b subunit